MDPQNLQQMFLIAFGFVCIFVVLAGLMRFTGALFSRTMRAEILKQPLLHIVWFVITAFVVLCFFFPIFSGNPHLANSARRVMAVNDVTQIVTALKVYRTEYGVMPGGGNAQIMKTLMGDNTRKIWFIDVKKFNAAGEFIDPWGTPYRIDTSKPDFPWAYSFGPDKKDEGGGWGADDLVSWR